jgi:hypothetical protein
MNVLQRRMFAEGDEVKTLPLYEKHASGKSQVVYDRGVDPEFDSFLDRYGIDAPTYHRIHSEAGNFLIYDPGLKQFTPGIDLFAGRGILKGLGSVLTKKGTQGTGRFVGERLPGGVAGPNRPLTEITEEVTKLSPLGKSTAISTSVLPLAASTTIEDEDAEEDQEVSLVAKPQEDVIAEELKKVEESKTQTKAAKAKADRKKIETEIKSIEDVISAIQGFDKQKSEAYQQEKSRTRRRNTNIFMEEMAAALAGTTNLADGLSIGAANAAKRVGETEEAEELAKLERKKTEAALKEKEKISDQDWQDITKRYQESLKLLGKQENLMSIVNELKAATAAGNTTGGRALVARLIDDIAGFTGIGDTFVSEATKAVNKGKYLTAQSITEILQEGGKTVSDRDRDLIKDIMANFENWFMGKGEALDSLNRVIVPMEKAFQLSKSDLEAIESKFGDQIPQLQIYKKSFQTGIKSPTEDDADLQLTQEDIEDVID